MTVTIERVYLVEDCYTCVSRMFRFNMLLKLVNVAKTVKSCRGLHRDGHFLDHQGYRPLIVSRSLIVSNT